MKVLLLEDDSTRVVQFRNRLNSEGVPYELVHVDRASDAIVAMLEQRFDLILLDHDLGGRTYVNFTDEQEDCGVRVAEWLSIRPERVNQQGPPIITFALLFPIALTALEAMAAVGRIEPTRGA